MKIPRVGLAAFVVAMCALDVLWIRQNVAPPRMFDDAYYLIESVDLFHTLKEKGIGAFLAGTTVYSRRGHPPMPKILPTFMYLVLGPGTNEALYAYAALIVVFCVYLFLLARELLDNEGNALLAVVITCLFPITYGMWRHAMAEFGIAVAVTGCLYHLIRSQTFQRSGHALAVGLFVGWGFLWKVTFPVFVGGAIALVLFRSRRELSMRGLAVALVAVLVVAGPFYARSWLPVVAFTLFAGEPENQRVWGLGPVFSPLTVARYWLSVINWGISPYLFGLLMISWAVARRCGPSRDTRDKRFLLLSFSPAFVVLTFHPLKEVRHLLPVLPIVGIATAGLVAGLLTPLRRGLQPVVMMALMLWPTYQFLSWSFDSPLIPRADLHMGPIMLSVTNLEAESLEWMPTYTYPANTTRWPSQEALQRVMNRLSSRNEPARVHVAGTNPYFNALTLTQDARIARLPLTFDPPFTDDYSGADFLIAVLANRRYGPVDRRPTAAERALKAGMAPFTLVGTLPLADGGTVHTYEANVRLAAARPGG